MASFREVFVRHQDGRTIVVVTEMDGKKMTIRKHDVTNSEYEFERIKADCHRFDAQYIERQYS